MEAKDTVIEISLEEADKCRGWASQRRKSIEEKLEHQAEISFPAGERQGYEKGIREVVEWIKNQRACDVEEIINEVGHRDRTLKPLNYFIIHESDIPLQLKEWGIESKGGERK